MTIARRRAGLAALAAGALAVGLAFAVARARPARQASAGGPLPAGRQLTWAATLAVKMRQAGGQKGGGGMDTTTTLTGDLVATVSGGTKSGYDLSFELRKPHVQGSGFGDVAAADLARLEQSLTTRFWVTYQADGAARLLHFPRALGHDVRNFLALLVTESQFVRPAGAPLQWTATERDGAGAYLVAYRQTAPEEIAKRKLGYLAVDGAGGPMGALGVEVEGAESRFTLDAGGLVAKMTARERHHVSAGLGMAALTVELELTLSERRTGEDRSLIGSLEKARETLETGPIATQQDDDEALQARQDAQLIKNVTLAELLAPLGGAPVPAQADAQAAIRLPLEALLRQRPGEIPAALAFARGARQDAARLVLESLGVAGTPAAQEALGSLASDAGVPAPLRLAAINAVVLTKRPTAGTIAWLVRLLDAPDRAVSRQALFLLGAAGNNCRESDPDAAARVEAELLRRYQGCSGAVCADLLIGLGNLGTAGLVPTVAQALKAPDARVRTAAAQALRRVNHPDVDRLIADAMAADPDPAVRSAAVDAATSRSLGPFVEPLSTLLRNDKVAFVRTHAIQAIANHLDEAPQLEQALLAAANGDPSPGVQRMARQALGPRLAKGL